MMIPDRRTLKQLFLGSVLAVSIVGCQAEVGDVDANDSTATAAASDIALREETTRKFMDEVFNKGNFAMIDSMVAPDFIEHTSSPGQEPGIAGLKKWFGDMRAAYPDMNTTVEHVISAGDLTAIHIHQTGTNSGPLMGMPATNKKIDTRGVDLVRFANGKVIEHWGYYEEMKMMTQLGLMPAMGGAPSGTSGTVPTTGGDTSKPSTGDTSTSGDTTKR